MAPLKSTTEAEIRFLRSEACHGIALTGRTLIVLWQTETRNEAVGELARLLAARAAEVGSVALLQVIGDGATPPDAAARAALATMLKDNETRIVASAVVFEGTGFRASLIRSLVIGISMLSRPKCPHTVFASVSEGVAWLCSHLGGSDSERHASGMRQAIDRLRQRETAR